MGRLNTKDIREDPKGRPKKKIGVLISGRGSNLQALIDAQRRGELGGEIAVVVSNVETAAGLERARRAGIPTVVRDHRGRTREDFDAEVPSPRQAWAAATANPLSVRGVAGGQLLEGFIKNWSESQKTALVGRMIADVVDHPGGLPLLQYIDPDDDSTQAIVLTPTLTPRRTVS